MKKSYILTTHAKKRANERPEGLSNLKPKALSKEFQKAMLYGDFRKKTKGEFKEHLENIQSVQKPGVGIKVYKGKVWIHQNRKLITLYDIPEQYKGDLRG